MPNLAGGVATEYSWWWKHSYMEPTLAFRITNSFWYANGWETDQRGMV